MAYFYNNTLVSDLLELDTFFASDDVFSRNYFLNSAAFGPVNYLALTEPSEEASFNEADNEGEAAEDAVSADADSPVLAPSGPLFAIINGDAGDNIINGTSSADIIHGNGGNDTINGLGTADQIFGDAGDDTMILINGQGSDNFDGGTGTDTLDFSGFTTAVTFDLAASTYSFGQAISIENVIAGSAGDTIIGTSGANDLDGRGGNDTISGGSGDDIINGGAGDDLLEGGLDNDTIHGGAGNDIIFANTQASPTGSTFGDILHGDAGDDTITGANGDDTIFVGTGADTADGGAGDDTFDMDGGFDTSNVSDLDGGAGTDSFVFDDFGADYSINLTTGEWRQSNNNLLVTLTNIENVTAGSGNDTITGDGNVNVLNGGNGNDTIEGGGSRDVLNGEGGNDTFVYISFSSFDDIDGGSGTDLLDLSNGSGANYVNLLTEVWGNTSATATFDAISVENVIGNSGNNEIIGSAGDNVLSGNAGDDTIEGGDGNDTIDGGAGADTMDGGNGDDTFIVSAAGTTLGDDFNGGSGTDTLDLSALTDDITLNADGTGANGVAGNSFDLTAGGQGATLSSINNYLFGSGNDTIYMDAGADFHAGDGDDILYVEDTNISNGDIFNGGTGTDTLDLSLDLVGAYVTDLQAGTLTLGAEVAILIDIENVNGNGDDDTIIGTSGANIINGNDGNDMINGGSGIDTLDGGSGDDTFTDSHAAGVGDSDVYIGGSGNDTVIYTANLGGTIRYDLSTGEQTLFGTVVRDTYAGIENLTVNGSGTVIGDANHNLLIATGASSNNTIDGGGGNDTIDAGGGDDIVIGGAGDDNLDGGAGTDTLDYSGSGAAVQVNLATGTTSGGDAEGDFITNFESIEGSAFDDTLTSTDAGGVINGNDGNDTLMLTGGLFGATLDGGNGDDIIISAQAMGGSTLLGGAGNDDITAFADSFLVGASDVADGGTGDDIIRVGGPGDVLDMELDGGADIDTLSLAGLGNGYTVDLGAGTLANNTSGFAAAQAINFENVEGSDGADTITGDGGDNVINGNGGNDIIDSGAGNDTVNGGAGNDEFIDNQGTSAALASDFDGGSGIDIFRSEVNWSGNVIFDLAAGEQRSGVTVYDTFTNIENLSIGGAADAIGDANANEISFVNTGVGQSSNTVDGGAGDDIINANNGDDFVTGGAGADTMDGGTGTDTLDYSGSGAAVDINLDTNTASGGDAAGDVISNFENLEGSAFGDTLEGNAATVLINGNDGDDIIYTGTVAFFVTANGGDGDDMIYGTSSASTFTFNSATLNGGNGNDQLFLSGDMSFGHIGNGGDGDDIISIVPGGNWTATYGFNGDAGIDTMDMSNLATGLEINLATGGANFNGQLGDPGSDLSEATISGIENVIGTQGDDTIIGDGGSNVLTGGGGADVINGGAGDDVINGGGGNDTTNGGAGDDRFVYGLDFSLDSNVDGGADSDTIDFSAWNVDGFELSITDGYSFDGSVVLMAWVNMENIDGSQGVDLLTGDGGVNILNGNDGDDDLFGGAGNDILNGGAGNDDLTGGEGADVLNGGAGRDRLFYNFASTGVTVNLFNAALNTGEAAGDTYSSIESLNGSNFDDSLTSGNDNNDLVGLNGNDVLIGAGGRDRLFGGNGDDRLLGGTGNDDLNGAAGADTYVIQAGAGRDRIFTFEVGIDTIEMRDAAASFAELTITQVGANTEISHVNGVTVLMGITAGTVTAGDFIFINPLPAPTGVDITTNLTAGDDSFIGDENNDIVNGLAGNDIIRGGIGDDTLNGGDGNDQLIGGFGADVLDGGAGVDRAVYSSASTGVTINAINSALNTGEAAGDTYISIENFYGSAHNDNITGDSGNNDLVGLDGNDTLIGAGGNDRLFGGNDNDRLLGGTGNDDLYGQGGNDTYVIRANAGNDRIFGFEDGLDIIEIHDGPPDFMALTIMQNGADTIVILGVDVLTLKDFTAADLDASDFTFFNPAAEAPTAPKGSAAQEGAGTDVKVEETLDTATDQDVIAEFLTQSPLMRSPLLYTDVDGIFAITPDMDSKAGYDFFEALNLF